MGSVERTPWSQQGSTATTRSGCKKVCKGQRRPAKAVWTVERERGQRWESGCTGDPHHVGLSAKIPKIVLGVERPVCDLSYSKMNDSDFNIKWFLRRLVLIVKTSLILNEICSSLGVTVVK